MEPRWNIIKKYMPLPEGVEGNDHNYMIGDPYPEKEVHKLISEAKDDIKSVVDSNDRITAKEACLRDLLRIYVIAKIELSKISEQPIKEGRQWQRWAEDIEVFIEKVQHIQNESGLDGFEIKLELDEVLILKKKNLKSLTIPMELKEVIWDYIVKETDNFPPVEGEEVPKRIKHKKTICHSIVKGMHSYLTGEHSLGNYQSDEMIRELTDKTPFRCLGKLKGGAVRKIRE